MRIGRISPTIACFLLLLSVAGLGQTISPIQYSMKDGLPSNNIECIYQDSNGFMWFGTTNGLSVFDGRSFRNYGMKDGLPNAFIRKIFEDNKRPGAMWILSGIHVCRFADGKFFTFTLQTSMVNDIYQDRQGIVWCATERGILQIDGEKMQQFRPTLLDTAIYIINAVGDSVLWFAIEKSLVSYSKNSHSFSKIDLHKYSDGIIRALQPDFSGGLWVGIGEDYLLYMYNQSLKHAYVQKIPNAIFSLDKKGFLWTAGYTGIARIQHQTKTSLTTNMYTKANGLSENSIRSLYTDREGILWIGGRDNGVMKLTNLNLVRFPLDNLLTFTLTHDLQYACSDLNNHIWVISEKLIKEFWRDSSGIWHMHSNSITLPTNAGTLFIDQSNRLWVMNFTSLFCFRLGHDFADGHTRLVLERNFVAWNGYAIAFLLTHNNAIVQGGSGIAQTVSNSTGRTIRYFGAECGVPTNYIRKLFEDKSGNIWIGTFQEGLAKVYFDSENNIHVKRFTLENGFPSIGVWSILQDKSGSILVGTPQSGLITINNDSIKTLTVKDGLPSNLIRSMTIDSSGRLWIGTTIGMSYETKPGSRNFISKRKFLGSEPYCCGTTINGLIWYVTSSDLFVYDPYQENESTIDPPIHITELKINGIEQNLEREISVAHDQNNFEISYIGISFANERDLTYQYRLLGLEIEWRGPTQSTFITYGHLHPGSYRFEVRSINEDGIISGVPASIAFIISTPIWRTLWFQIFSVCFLIGIIWWWYRLRIDRIRTEEKITENFSRTVISQQEIERKRIAHELHDGLGQEFIVISNRAKKGLKAIERDQMKNQLDLIVQSASQALESVREIAMDLSPYHLEHFGLTCTLQSMITRLTESSQINVTFEIQNIDSGIEKQYHIHVYRIMQEAVTNIVKHACASHVNVRIMMDTRNLHIIIADNGKGFSLKDSKAGPTHRGGLGLPGLMERAKIIGGTCSIESSVGRGTTLTFTSPLYTGTQFDSTNNQTGGISDERK